MLKLVIFDMDGTLVEFNLNFGEIKRRIADGEIEGTILEYISGLESEEKRRAERILREYEVKAAERAYLLPHARDLLKFLDLKGIKKALFTRNNRSAVEIVMRKFNLKFDIISTREDGEVKPSGEQVKKILKLLRVKPEEALVVGDHEFDFQAARASGVKAVLLKGRFSEEIEGKADYIVNNLKELEEVILRIQG